MMNSAYKPQPSTFVLLKANIARASDTPFSTMAANCISWPGRASWEVSVQDAAAKVKSSYFSVAPAAAGIINGRTNSPLSPVLPISRGGLICGAGLAALSAGLARTMRAGRFGRVTRRSRRMISSICAMRCGNAAGSGLADQLILLQLADHVAVILHGPALLRAPAAPPASAFLPGSARRPRGPSRSIRSAGISTPYCVSEKSYSSVGRRKSARLLGSTSLRTKSSYAAICSFNFA